MIAGSFRVLFVCHANLCRSPLAEHLARRAFDDAFGAAAAGVLISSAGTRAHDGSPMHGGSAAVLAERGIDAGGFSSRTVNASVLGAADLVLTAARDQRAACVTLAPATVRRTFALRQFARLTAATSSGRVYTSATPPERLRELVDAVNNGRHLAPAAPACQDDLADPVDRPIAEFRECAREIWRSVSTVVEVISAR